MRLVIFLGFGLALVAIPQVLAQSKKTPAPAEANGAVEIHGIQIERQIASYAAKSADLTHMTLSLWLPFSDYDGGPKHDEYLVRLTELEAVEDDTGKLLSTKSRRDDATKLKGEALLPYMWWASRGKQQGPLIYLRLDAPVRRAAVIKNLQGKVEVQRVQQKTIMFEDIHKSSGKALTHPLFKGVKITPTIETGKGETTFTLDVSGRPWPVDWQVWHAGKRLSASGETGNAKFYYGEYPKNCSLQLVMPVAVESKTISFKFKDVELP